MEPAGKNIVQLQRTKIKKGDKQDLKKITNEREINEKDVTDTSFHLEGDTEDKEESCVSWI